MGGPVGLRCGQPLQECTRVLTVQVSGAVDVLGCSQCGCGFLNLEVQDPGWNNPVRALKPDWSPTFTSGVVVIPPHMASC